MSCLDSYFGALPDPRAANVGHRLGDLMVMMIAASLCGASSATEFALFARERRQALSRLLRLIDPEAFAAFAAGFAQACQGVVALDGKALRRAYEAGLSASPPLTVSAFAADTDKVPISHRIKKCAGTTTISSMSLLKCDSPAFAR